MVSGREARLAYDTWLPGVKPAIVTAVEFEVEVPIRGEGHRGDVIHFDILGGEYGDRGTIVAGQPSMPLGARYLLFLGGSHPEEDIWLPIIGFYRLPAQEHLPNLPPSSDLAAVLTATCRAHPKGIYFRDRISTFVVPKSVLLGAYGQFFQRLLESQVGSDAADDG